MKKQGRLEALVPSEAVVKAKPRGIQAGQSSRIGKKNVTAYVDGSVWQKLRLIQVKKPDARIQTLVEEALEDLFVKYGVVGSAR